MSTKKLNENNFLVEKIKILRSKTIRKKLKFEDERLNKPVSFWIKEDRLLKEKGKEFTIILRTKGCSWALGETGGCSMCGYIQDSTIEEIDPIHIINQFDYAFQKKIKEISTDKDDFILKIFNSGSFFDNDEISADVREHIYNRIAEVPKIKEIVVESRVDYITRKKLKKMKSFL